MVPGPIPGRGGRVNRSAAGQGWHACEPGLSGARTVRSGGEGSHRHATDPYKRRVPRRPIGDRRSDRRVPRPVRGLARGVPRAPPDGPPVVVRSLSRPACRLRRPPRLAGARGRCSPRVREGVRADPESKAARACGLTRQRARRVSVLSRRSDRVGGRRPRRGRPARSAAVAAWNMLDPPIRPAQAQLPEQEQLRLPTRAAQLCLWRLRSGPIDSA